jgi:hypothetical protein
MRPTVATTKRQLRAGPKTYRADAGVARRKFGLLGASAEHETKDYPAHMTKMALHIGWLVGAYLIRGYRDPLAFHVHLHGLVANSNIRIIDRLTILGVAAGDAFPRHPV